MQQVPESRGADLGDRYLMALLECVRGWLQVRFDSQVELDLIALLAAPEIDPAFLRAYANLWDDFGRKSVDLVFAAELLGADLRDRKRLIQALAADSIASAA